MLEFILGRACSGKTHEIVKRVALASKSGKAVLIVPEQFTFETERAIIKYDDANANNISVLSFTRLYDEVMQSFGRGCTSCVSEFEKIILIKRALKSCEENLQVFTKYICYRDFALSLADTIQDIKFAGVSVNELYLASEEIGGNLGAKLNDIALVMSAYDALLENKYIDPSDRLTKLFYELDSLEYFKDKTVFFDSFTGFTGQQYKIIEKIFEQAKDVVFSVVTDNPDDTAINVFYNTNFAVNRIKSIAKSKGIKDVSTHMCESNFYSNNAMSHLEKISATNYSAKNVASNGNVRIISCNNRRDEAVAAANIIAKEVRENGYRYRDFIVVARNTDDYLGYVARQCKVNNIACFMDRSVKLSATPICLYLSTLFELVKSFSTDNILKLLKLGLLDFTTEEIASIEDYTYIWDIKGSDWKKDWVMSVRGLQTDEDSERDKQALDAINELRRNVYKIIFDFKETFVGTPKQRSKAVYLHLIKNKIDEKLSIICSQFEEDEDNYNASLLKQSWDDVVLVLDSLCRVLDNSEVATNDYVDAFLIAADVSKISNVPQMLDEVTFGGADRIRPSKPKISIILGANQGVFPHHSTKSGILVQSDKDKLQKYGIVLDDTVRGAVEENYLVYAMLCCPVDKAYVLYSKKSMLGEEMEPSSFIYKILDSFNDMEVTDFALSSSGEFVPQTPKSAFLEIGSVASDDFANIAASLKDYSQYKTQLENMARNFEELDFSVSSDASHQLFGSQLHISATKFDTFHKCSLSFLLKNGLKIKRLQKADLNVLQRGTIVHFVLENIVEKHKEKLSELSNLQISAEVDTLIHQYMSSVRGADILMSARFAYLLDKISASVKEIVYHIAEEFSQSDFIPMFCELTIGDDGDIPRMQYTLSDGSNAYFDGKIDRVDVYKNNVRVVDYKTGRMTFTLSDTLVGLNMQMLLYLYAFIKNGDALVSNPKPAGILYMPAKTSKKTKLLRMNGLISNSDEVRIAMEKENAGRFVPKFTANSDNYISAESFDLIFSKIDELILKMGDTVRSGKFTSTATDGANIKACAYCDFSPICRSSNKEHKVSECYSNSEVIDILKRGEEGGV